MSYIDAAVIMFILSQNCRRWRIIKDDQIIFSGIGSPTNALAVAGVFGIVLTRFTDKPILKAA